MADRDPMQVLNDMAGGYLNPQAYDLEDLKAFLEEAHNAEAAKKFETALSETVNGNGLSREAWEQTTDDEFDDDEEWQAYLASVQAFLFDGGPYPFPDDEEE